MHKNFWIGTVLALAVALVGSVVWLSAGSAQIGPVNTTAMQPEAQVVRSKLDTSTANEVQRLRAELRRKDELVRTLRATQPINPPQSNEVLAAPSPTQADPAVRAVDALDERLMLGSRDPRRAAELEAALREVVESVPLGGASVGSVYCNSDLCKIAFEADTPQKANHAVGTTAMKAPKTLPVTAAYPLSDGHIALYLGRTQADIAIPEDAELTMPSDTEQNQR